MQRSMATRNVKLVPLSADDKPLVLRKLQGSIHFERTLRATTAPGSHDKIYTRLTLPAHFVRKHGDKFEKSALLRTEASTEPWRVNLTISNLSPTSAQVRFSGGWKAFAISNGLLEGDTLIFVLTAMSEFKVYVFRSIEGPNENPSRRQGRWSGESDQSQKKTMWPYRKCRDARLRADESSSDEGKNGGKNCARRKSSAVYDSAAAPIPSILQEIHFASPSELLEDTNSQQCQSERRSFLGVS